MNGRLIGWLRVHLQKIRQLGFVIACVSNWLVADIYIVPDFENGTPIDADTDVEPRGGLLTIPFLSIAMLAIAQVWKISSELVLLPRSSSTTLSTVPLTFLPQFLTLLHLRFQIGCTGLLFVFHLLFKTPPRVQELWSNKDVGKTSRLFRLVLQSTQMDKQIATNGRVGRINFRRQPCAWLVYWSVSIWWASTEVEIVYLAAAVAAAVLGITHHNFFLAFHLLGELNHRHCTNPPCASGSWLSFPPAIYPPHLNVQSRAGRFCAGQLEAAVGDRRD